MGFICRLKWTEKQPKRKSEKSFKKGVDKSEDMRYTKQAVAESGREH
jgi:hypothetical protein